MVGRRQIRRISVVRTSAVVALILVIAPAVIFIPIALAGILVFPGAAPGTLGSVELLVNAVVAPLFYGFIGWPVSALVLLVYNVVARFFGGIEYEVEELYAAAIDTGEGDDAATRARKPS